MRHSIALPVILSITGCLRHPGRSAATQAIPADRTVHRFDVVARGVDDNGFALDPEFGYAFNERCAHQQDTSGDPSTCSWWFDVEGAEPVRGALLCSRDPVDPIFADNFGTLLGLTCSDSPLHYPGHLNWGSGFGNAMTFEGTLSWDDYSGEGPFGDF